jgi:type IX secretion system PorP/SprF family membrane protein
MKKNNRLKIIVAAALAFPSLVSAQDVHFSQFYETATMRNPALTGIFTGEYKAGVNYRSQWSNVAVPFVTYLASAETKIAINNDVADFLSIGLTATYDKAGTISFNSLSTYLSVNYNKAMGDERHSYLSVALAGGYVQRSADVTKMTFANQFVNGSYSASNSAREGLGNGKVNHYDVGAGISFNSSLGENGRTNYYIGAAAYHINKPKESFYDDAFSRLTTRWTANAGFHSAIADNLGLAVHANYQYQQPYQEAIGGLLLGWRGRDIRTAKPVSLYAGCFYRYQDALIPTIKFDWKGWGITASYDLGFTQRRTYMNKAGGLELSIFTRGLYPKKLNGRDPVRCPRFEEMIDLGY